MSKIIILHEVDYYNSIVAIWKEIFKSYNKKSLPCYSHDIRNQNFIKTIVTQKSCYFLEINYIDLVLPLKKDIFGTPDVIIMPTLLCDEIYTNSKDVSLISKMLIEMLIKLFPLDKILK